MTDAKTMMHAVAGVVQRELAHLAPLGDTENKFANPAYNAHREALNQTEKELRKLIVGNEVEQHEWLAVIHYALAEERSRLL